MSSGQKKVLTTDLLMARSIGSRDYRAGTDISENYVLVADGKGGSSWAPNVATAVNAFTAVSVGNPVSGIIYASGLGSGNTIQLDASGYITLTPVPTSNKITIGIDTSELVRFDTVGAVIDNTIDNRLGNQLDTLGSTRSYVSTPSMVSTVEGLGTAGYVSTSGLTSTVFSLNTSIEDVSGYLRANYPTNAVLTSRLDGLGTTGYVSSQSLTSTTLVLNTSIQQKERMFMRIF